jgi:hypothetical protein
VLSALMLCTNILSGSFIIIVGPHPPNGYNPPLTEEDFFCVTCFVLLLSLFIGLISSF